MCHGDIDAESGITHTQDSGHAINDLGLQKLPDDLDRGQGLPFRSKQLLKLQLWEQPTHLQVRESLPS